MSIERDQAAEIRRLRRELGIAYRVILDDHARARRGAPCVCVYCEAARRHYAGLAREADDARQD